MGLGRFPGRFTYDPHASLWRVMLQLAAVSLLLNIGGWTDETGSIPTDRRMGVRAVGGEFLHGHNATFRCQLLDDRPASFRVDALLVKDDSQNLYAYQDLSRGLLFLAPSRINARYSYDTAAHALLIKDVRCSDEREFHCILLNSHTKESVKSSAFIKVKVPPSDIQIVTSYPDMQDGIPAGISVTFKCTANTGRRGKGRIVWRYTGVGEDPIRETNVVDIPLRPKDVPCTERMRSDLTVSTFISGTFPVVTCYVINDDFPDSQSTGVCDVTRNATCRTTGVINVLYDKGGEKIEYPVSRIMEPLGAYYEDSIAHPWSTNIGPSEYSSSKIIRPTESLTLSPILKPTESTGASLILPKLVLLYPSSISELEESTTKLLPIESIGLSKEGKGEKDVGLTLMPTYTSGPIIVTTILSSTFEINPTELSKLPTDQFDFSTPIKELSQFKDPNLKSMEPLSSKLGQRKQFVSESTPIKHLGTRLSTKETSPHIDYIHKSDFSTVITEDTTGTATFRLEPTDKSSKVTTSREHPTTTIILGSRHAKSDDLISLDKEYGMSSALSIVLSKPLENSETDSESSALLSSSLVVPTHLGGGTTDHTGLTSRVSRTILLDEGKSKLSDFDPESSRGEMRGTTPANPVIASTEETQIPSRSFPSIDVEYPGSYEENPSWTLPLISDTELDSWSSLTAEISEIGISNGDAPRTQLPFSVINPSKVTSFGSLTMGHSSSDYGLPQSNVKFPKESSSLINQGSGTTIDSIVIPNPRLQELTTQRNIMLPLTAP